MNSLQNERLLNARVSGQREVADANTMLVVKYVGSEASGTVTVSSSGDLTFQHGDLSSEAVDSTIDSGGDDAGVIDVSDSNADTMGEVVDLINASANWQAYLVGALRADNSNASTGSLLTKAETQAKVSGGITLFGDTSKIKHISLVLRNGRYPNDDWAANSSGQIVNETLELGKFSEVTRVIQNHTGSGADTIKVYRIDRKTGTATLVWTSAGGTSGTEKDLDLTDSGGRGLACDPDEYLLIRIDAASTFTAGNCSVLGRVI